jgi:hypothetical protein
VAANPSLPIEQRLEVALELQHTGIELMRQNFVVTLEPPKGRSTNSSPTG